MTGPPADSLRAPGRRGIARLDWLKGEHEFENHMKAPRILVLGESEVMVEVAYALIEELHDAVNRGTAIGTQLVGEGYALATVIDRLTPHGIKALVAALKEANLELDTKYLKEPPP